MAVLRDAERAVCTAQGTQADSVANCLLSSYHDVLLARARRRSACYRGILQLSAISGEVFPRPVATPFRTSLSVLMTTDIHGGQSTAPAGQHGLFCALPDAPIGISGFIYPRVHHFPPREPAHRIPRLRMPARHT